jgi:hypothetical protein
MMALFERRLVELGCPAAQLRSNVRELAEHHEDLKHAALVEGLSEAAAEARADELLGEPVNLAGRISAVLRQSTWWGRHPVIAFCLLPLLAMPVMAILGLALDALAGWLYSLYFTADELSILANDGPEIARARMVGVATWCVMTLLTSALFFRLARRGTRGLNWALAACVVGSIANCCIGFRLNPHEFGVYCTFPPALRYPNWILLFAPLPAVAVAWRGKRRSLRRIPVPDGVAGGSPPTRKQLILPRTGFLTPSSVIATIAVGTIVMLGFQARSIVMKQAAHHRERSKKIWPAERAAVMQQLKARQTASDAPEATTIPLKRWLNAGLTDSLGGSADTNGNNLSELPRGVHIFGGVPFDVEGRAQLMGRKLLETNAAFPVRARNLEIARKCRRIHLLHGASGITPEMAGAEIARLVVHYADGSQARIPIVAGGNVLDWWGPIYETEAGENARNPSAAGSELAWAGGNPWIAQEKPEQALRLYKSTFENPRPGVEISAIDYVSTVTDAAPFLLGLTVE